MRGSHIRMSGAYGSPRSSTRSNGRTADRADDRPRTIPRTHADGAPTRPGCDSTDRGRCGTAQRAGYGPLRQRQSGAPAPTAQGPRGGHRDPEPVEGADVASAVRGGRTPVHRRTGRDARWQAGAACTRWRLRRCALRLPGDARPRSRGGEREGPGRTHERGAWLAAGAPDGPRDARRTRGGHAVACAGPARGALPSAEGGPSMMFTLEELYTSAAGFAVPASATQRAILRAIEGRSLGELGAHPAVVEAFGGEAAIA